MVSEAGFPKTLPYIGTVLGRRALAKPAPGLFTYRPSSQTEILSLRPDGTRTTQDDPKARLGVYVWSGNHWELEEVYNTRREARNAAARIRRSKSNVSGTWAPLSRACIL
jgi:hypothetical protein